MKDFTIYAFIFILGWEFGNILNGDKAYNLGLKLGKCVRQWIDRK